MAVRLLVCLAGISPAAVNKEEVASNIDKLVDILRESESSLG